MYAAIHPVLKKIYPEEKQFYYPPRKKIASVSWNDSCTKKGI